MSYLRVIPRDLFNESNFLKCLGQLYLNLDNKGLAALLVHEGEDEYFAVQQNQHTGALYITNITLYVGGEIVDGQHHDAMVCSLWRPLNSRAAYPLWLTLEDEDDIAVFNDDGTFSAEMIAFLAAEGPATC